LEAKTKADVLREITDEDKVIFLNKGEILKELAKR